MSEVRYHKIKHMTIMNKLNNINTTYHVKLSKCPYLELTRWLRITISLLYKSYLQNYKGIQ